MDNYKSIIETKTIKTAQKALNVGGPGGIMISVIPENRGAVRLIVGARAIDNTQCYASKRTLKELSEFLLELSETLE